MISTSTGAFSGLPRRHLLRAFLPGLVCLSLVLTSCTSPATAGGQATRLPGPLARVVAAQRQAQHKTTYPLAPRPAGDPKAIAEAYLQQYQPGPLPRVFENSYVYDRNGRLLAERIDEGRRTWIPLARTSQHLLDAVIATEDGTFYQNNGVDTRRMLGALVQNLRGGALSGASTITMQLVRNLFLPPTDRYAASLDRKVTEVLLAQELTQLFTKDEILELYLNLAYFGHSAYGPEAAARAYFGRSAQDLDAAEAALLAGILQSPAALDPFLNFEGAKKRQRIVLNLMVRRGYLTQAEADALFAQPLRLAEDANRQPVLAPHFLQYLTNYVARPPDNLSLGRSGLVITTTLDLELQELAQQIVREQVDTLRPRFDLSNGALVALKVGSAEILAMVGSTDFTNDAIGGQVNVTTRRRQPGSAIKPVVYAAALNANLVSPASLLWDLPITYTLSTERNYEPQNYDRSYRGPVTVRTALANSLNIPTLKLFDGLAREEFLATANAMGIASLAPEDIDRVGLALALGGDEVTPLELTNAYHTLANGGRFVEPTPIIAMTDAQGRPITLQAPSPPRQAISPVTAFLVTDIISDNKARAPIFGENSRLQLSRPAAAKTGTTTDFRDNWTVGFTRFLVAGVWAGNNDGRPMRNADGITGAGPIWQRFMEAVIADPALLAKIGAPVEAAAWAFTPPPDVVQVARPCPPELTCREGGEYFGTAWVNQRTGSGPYEDSFLTGLFAQVTVDQSDGSTVAAGLCLSSPTAAAAGNDPTAVTLLVEPRGLGRLAPQAQAVDTRASNTTGSTAVQATGATPPPIADSPPVVFLGPQPAGSSAGAGFTLVERERVLREQQAATAWAAQSGQLLTLGPCDQVAPFLFAAYGPALRGFTVGEPLTPQLLAALRPSSLPAVAIAGPNGIFSPAPGATLAGAVAVRAAADDPAFWKWQLDILVNGQQAAFLGLGEQPSAAPTDILLWDTATVPDGDHVLRLRVVRRDGNYEEYFVPVSVRNS